MSVLCSMVGASFVTVVAEVIRRKIGVSALGNAQVDTAQNKFGGASALFDGTGDYLDTLSTIVTFGTGDFTIECWARPSASLANNGIFHISPTGLGTGGSPLNRGLALAFYNTSGNGWVYYGGNADFGAAFGTAHSANTWYHLAMVRSSGTLKIYINGTSLVSIEDTNNYTAHRLVIGGYYSTSFLMNGHIDEFRISDTARYTTTFTPSTTPFVNDANTKLLLHMDGTDATTVFEDDNGTGRSQRGVSALGNAQIDTAQSKFGGSSALFDGTDDYLLISPSTDFALGTNDWTAEMWLRPNGTQASVIFDTRPTGAGNENGICLYYTGSNLTYYSGGNIRITGANLTQTTWQHIALVRNGNDHKLYINGTQSGSTYTATNSITSINPFVVIATTGNSLAQADYIGHIDEIRVSNTARYTAGFTPSTTPFVNDANTLLLLHMDGADATTVFRDDNGVGRSQRSVTLDPATNGAQVDTAQSKFGGASALFDGTLDLLTCAMVGSGYTATDLTIECWVRPAAVNQTKAIISSRSVDNTLPTGEFQLMLLDSSFSTKFQFAVGFNQVDMRSTTTYAANTWYHLAVTRNISTNGWTFYVNGTSEATATNATNLANNNIGIGALLTGSSTLNGHVDEVRISNTRRYTANFTPSTTPFQNDSNTLLLLHMDGTDASRVFIDDNGVYPA